ncbi:MAG: M42 family peptidase, partial [Chitinivibrionales bacterium]|nr:M42 family peptidase [Chitinivibrionales bacterium]
GPILHRGPNINIPLNDMLVKAAKLLKIKVQWAAEPRITGTDADPLQITRGGVATSLVSIPNRYTHTPVEMCSLSDIEDTARLVAEAVLSMPAQPHLLPY